MITARGLGLLRILHGDGWVFWKDNCPWLHDVILDHPGHAAALRLEWPTVEAVFKRAIRFRLQLGARYAPDPFVSFDRPPGVSRGCAACGEPVAAGEFRCGACTMAMAIVLEAPGRAGKPA